MSTALTTTGKSVSLIVDPTNYGYNHGVILETEQTLLGALLLENKAIEECNGIIQASSFSIPQHRYIYEACQQMYVDGKDIDLFSVMRYLDKNGRLEEAGGKLYFVQLTHNVASTALIRNHAFIIQEAALRRNTKIASIELMKCVEEKKNDVFEVLDRFGEIKERIESGIAQENERDGISVFENVIAAAATTKKQAISTGLQQLDEILTHGGFAGEEMTVIAARPGTGKSVFLVQMAKNFINNSEDGIVLFYSLEMSAEKVMQRMIASESGVTVAEMSNGALSGEKINKIISSAGSLATKRLVIDDSSVLTTEQLYCKVKNQSRKNKILAIFIDYIQLLDTSDQDKKKALRGEQVADVSRKIRALTKELKVPVICAAQMNRAQDYNGGGNPKLTHIGESDQIGKDAHCVIFIEPKKNYGGNSESILHIAKNRDGRTGQVSVIFNKEKQRFEDSYNIDNL